MVSARHWKINALTALVRIVDLGIDARKPLSETQVTQVSSWRERDEEIERVFARAEAIRMAKRVLVLNVDLKAN